MARRTRCSESVTPETPADPRRGDLAAHLAGVVRALRLAQVPGDALGDPDLRWYRGEPLATVDVVTRRNIGRCRALGDFGLDLDAAERLWDEAATFWPTPAIPRDTGDSEQAGYDVDRDREDDGAENEGQQGMAKRDPPNSLGGDVRVGYLECHADGE